MTSDFTFNPRNCLYAIPKISYRIFCRQLAHDVNAIFVFDCHNVCLRIINCYVISVVCKSMVNIYFGITDIRTILLLEVIFLIFSEFFVAWG